MKYKRIISSISVMAIVYSLMVVPAYAVEALPGTVQPLTPVAGGGSITVNLGDWVGDLAQKGIQGVVNKLDRLVHDDACTSGLSQNGRHNFQAQNTQVGDGYGNYYVCEYCGKSAGEVLESAYSTYTDNLPAESINSNGQIIWTPPHIWTQWLSTWNNNAKYNVCEHCSEYDSVGTCFQSMGCTSDCNVFTMDKAGTGFTYSQLGYLQSLWGDVAPITGEYKLKSGISGRITIKYVDSSTPDTVITESFSLNNVYLQAGNTYFITSPQYSQTPYVSKAYYRVYSVRHETYAPTFIITPESGAINTATGTTINDTTYYDIDSRPASISGDYGILGDNNELTKIDSQSIVNETDNSVYNPVTDTTYQVTSWDYDYSDRSYNLTLEGGDTMTVTYGDENVTINEGDTVYNVYYVVETPANDSGSGNTENHTHNYSSTVTREPTCTTRGVETYTCSECNNSYTKQLPALGHDWLIDSEVFTTYDENGDIVTQGYKIYKCTRCGEEYKSEDGSPPDSGGDSTDLTITDPTDDLQSFWDRMKNLFQTLPEMFGDLTEFLKDGWPYVPDEVMTLIEFGLGMVVFVGILNWLFKR